MLIEEVSDCATLFWSYWYCIQIQVFVSVKYIFPSKINSLTLFVEMNIVIIPPKLSMRLTIMAAGARVHDMYLFYCHYEYCDNEEKNSESADATRISNREQRCCRVMRNCIWQEKHAQPWKKLQQHLNSYTNKNQPKFAKVNLYTISNKVLMYSIFSPCSVAQLLIQSISSRSSPTSAPNAMLGHVAFLLLHISSA